jgi:hypothetical protein
MADHQHEPYEVYGTAATQAEVGDLHSVAAGLREDLGRAEERIRDLEEQVGQLLRERPV